MLSTSRLEPTLRPQSDAIATRDACRAYLDEQTFRLRPKDYCEKYPKWPGQVGLEIEMLPVIPGGDVPGRVKLQGPGETSAAILRGEAIKRGWSLEDTSDDHGQTLLLKVGLDDGDNFSFEPGGQVEFSSRPYPCLSEAVRRLRSMQALLDQLYAQHGYQFVQMGINPWHSVQEIGLQMPKGRYRAMDAYFASISEYGQRMMRQTCTVQVNLDFGPDEATLSKRYLASQLLAPFAAATFAFSPIVDRKVSSALGFRSRIWRHADPTHTGLPGLSRLASGKLSREACIETYLDFVLGAHVVFVTDLDYLVPKPKITFGEWIDRPINGVKPTLADFATHMTLMFPEVRPRGFLELRSVDCQPRVFEAVPAAYWTGLLYDDRTLGRLIDLLLPRQAELPELLVKSEAGLKHPALAALASQVMELATSGFSALPECFKSDGAEKELAAFREHFTARGRTPADDLVDATKQEQRSFISLSGLRALETRWASLVQ